MPESIFTADVSKPMQDQEVPGHNRWHPDIPAAASTDPGTDFRIECLDWTNGQVRNDDSADDIRDIDLTPCHVLSGPVHINGAEPGDLLVVDILDMGPQPDRDSSRATLASSPSRTAEGSSPTSTPTLTRRSGTSVARMQARATCRTWSSWGSDTRGSSAALLPTICFLDGTGGSRLSSIRTRIGCRRWPFPRSRTTRCWGR